MSFFSLQCMLIIFLIHGIFKNKNIIHRINIYRFINFKWYLCRNYVELVLF